MKPTFAVLCAATFLSTAAFAKETTTVYRVTGWHCEDCSEKTASVVKDVKGVKDAQVDFANKKLTVVYDDEVAKATDITGAVNTLRYKDMADEAGRRELAAAARPR